MLKSALWYQWMSDCNSIATDDIHIDGQHQTVIETIHTDKYYVINVPFIYLLMAELLMNLFIYLFILFPLISSSWI